MTTESAAICFRFTRRAMATAFEVVLPFGGDGARRAADTALDLIDQLEAQLTVYRSASEVSRLNRLAFQAPVPVEANLFGLLTLCERISRETGGAFDVTAGPLIRAWGFYRRAGCIPTDDELAEAQSRVGFKLVRLDTATQRVRFGRPDVEINFGAVGKGYALDRAANRLRAAGIDEALLSGGGSSVLAIGQRSWDTGLQHPTEHRRLGIVRLRGRALGVSGATHQSFRYNGRTYGHLIDPRIGQPAEGIALAAALAPTAAEADALATAFYVLGVDGTCAYCDANPTVSAVVLPDGPAGEPLAINLDEGDWELSRPDAAYNEVPTWTEA